MEKHMDVKVHENTICFAMLWLCYAWKPNPNICRDTYLPFHQLMPSQPYIYKRYKKEYATLCPSYKRKQKSVV
jgi:hypothetical protein